MRIINPPGSGEGAVRVAAVGGLASSFGAAEVDLFNYPIQANTLSKIGNGFRATFTGVVAINANAKTLRLRLGGTLISTIALVPSAAINWRVVWEAVKQGASVQQSSGLITQVNIGTLALAQIVQLSVASAEIDTAQILLRITGQGVGASDIISQGGSLELY